MLVQPCMLEERSDKNYGSMVIKNFETLYRTAIAMTLASTMVVEALRLINPRFRGAYPLRMEAVKPSPELTG